MSIATVGWMRRFWALLKKETRQLWRDRSNLAVGFLLPIILILLFGYGLSLDVKNAPVAVVLEDRSPLAESVMSGLKGSEYLAPQRAETMAVAEKWMRDKDVQAIVRVPVDFSRQWVVQNAQIQVILDGVDALSARINEGYIRGAIGSWGLKNQDRAAVSASHPTGQGVGSAIVSSRMWFNEASTSTWYLVPGLIVLILTLIGALLTSMVIAREWERGTLESLFVTPVRPLEIVIAKVVPYLVVGFTDLLICLMAARFLFEVPIRGSLWVILLVSLIYLLVSLFLGLCISAVTRNQFEASQGALLLSYLPAVMLSGFIFDLRNVPAPIQMVCQTLPATHFMGLLKTLFLAGDNHELVLKDGLILLGYALTLLAITCWRMRKCLK
ncbi:MAG: ABC transporter permease [Sutterella wadsworthensis]|jgi:hypothetical protein|nr:ABC transporter permease [Sutterella wadsworthensis]